MEVIISFFLGSMVLFQIIMSIIIAGLIFSTISPNVRAHISDFFSNTPKKPPDTSKPPKIPDPTVNITPPLKLAPQLQQAQLQISPIVVEPQPIVTHHIVTNNEITSAPPIISPPPSQRIKSYDLYSLALEISKLPEDDIDGMEYMEDNDPRIAIYKEAIRIAYVKITGDTRAIPTNLLPPYKKFVLVSIMDKDTGIYYTKKLYSYFLGDRNDVSKGDDVIVYVKKGKHPQRRIAKIMYISTPYVPPLNVTKSPISIKVKGKFLTSKHGRKFHDPCCKQMDKTSNDEAIWFQSEAEALNKGYAPCAKCILR